jgi:hypothetical protein
MRMALDLNYGNAVTGSQRFARPELEERFLRALTSSAGLKMFGLRRTGKSTLRLFATESFDKMSRPYVSLDGQGLHSLNDLLSRLTQAMPGEKGGLVGRALGFISTGPAKAALEALSKGSDHGEKILSAYWRLVSDAILASLKGPGPKPVLVFDEFSYLISNMIKRDGTGGPGEVDKLLASMREWRGAGMVMLLTGSLGISYLLRKHGLNVEHLNDLQPFTVPELTMEEAHDFIRQATDTPSEGRWTAAHTDEFLRQTGVLYPCFLVRGLLEVRVDHPADASKFATIFAERVRPDLHADFYNQFNRRFSAYAELENAEQSKLLLPALKAVMETEAGCCHDSIPCPAPFTRVDLGLALTMLTEDGFIHFVEDAEGDRLWKPASRLAKLWWKRSKLA